jgi:hypothetical protein
MLEGLAVKKILAAIDRSKYKEKILPMQHPWERHGERK